MEKVQFEKVTQEEAMEIPEVKAEHERLQAFMDRWKKEMGECGFVGTMVVGNASKIKFDEVKKAEKCMLHVMSTKTIAAPFTIFGVDANGDLAMKADTDAFQKNATLHLVESMVESLQDQVASHKKVLTGLQLTNLLYSVVDEFMEEKDEREARESEIVKTDN